jgi:sarcosine oxidase, subunit gamma
MPEAFRSTSFAAHVNLRGDPADAAFRDRVRTVLGLELPDANRTAVGEIGVVYWLGPDEWLIASLSRHAGALMNELRASLGDLFSAVTDVSGGQTVYVLAAPQARDVLAQDCPLDLHPRALGVGQCAQTRLAKAAVLLRPVEGDAMEITVRRSFAGYLELWLRHSTTSNAEIA